MIINHRPFLEKHYQHLCQQGLPPLLAKIYAAREISCRDQLGGELKQLIPPDLLHGIHTMSQLLADALLAKQKLLIIGDYDCDGATATVVALKAIKRMGGQVDFLVPNRFEYGYGLSPELVDYAQQQYQPDWMITVDNGIASVTGVERANQFGIKVLITDHHLAGQSLPNAAAIVNPNQPDCQFPSKHLAGVGVIFYVMLMLRSELRARGIFQAKTQPILHDLIDLVALGTVADLVKLDRNNRILVDYGLDRMQHGKANPGIKALFQVAGRDIRHASSQDLAFSIGPRINAAGRLEDISIGIHCLASEDMSEALRLAQQLNDINQQRRGIEEDITFSAESLLQHQEIQDKSTICLFDESWHHGVIGIVASRIKEAFHRPVIVFAPDEQGLLRGSGRSITNLHLRDALDAVTKLDNQVIIKFGGHAMAAGLTIAPKHYDRFCCLFEKVVSSWISPGDLQKSIFIDGSLAAHPIDIGLAEMLERQSWGQGFPVPSFCDDFDVQQQRIVAEKHLKLTLAFPEKPDQPIQAIFFSRTDLLPTKARLVYQLQINRFNAKQTIQLQILHVLEQTDQNSLASAHFPAIDKD